MNVDKWKDQRLFDLHFPVTVDRLRLVRRGNAFYGYASDDGVDWRILGAYGWIDPPDEMLVGIAMTSHANCDVQILSFDNLSMGAPDPIVPTVPENAPAPTP